MTEYKVGEIIHFQGSSYKVIAIDKHGIVYLNELKVLVEFT